MVEYINKTKDNKCVFCEIAKRNFSTPGIFYEDEKHMAFLSIFPNTDGFSVCIPKKHFGSDVLKMPDLELKEFVLFAKKVAKILESHYDDVGRVGLMMEGTGINHAHIKLFPMHKTKYLKNGGWKQCLIDIEEEFYDGYKGFITSSEGPRADDEKLKKLSQDLQKIKLN